MLRLESFLKSQRFLLIEYFPRNDLNTFLFCPIKQTAAFENFVFKNSFLPFTLIFAYRQGRVQKYFRYAVYAVVYCVEVVFFKRVIVFNTLH